jgi:hypothetical protein
MTARSADTIAAFPDRFIAEAIEVVVGNNWITRRYSGLAERLKLTRPWLNCGCIGADRGRLWRSGTIFNWAQ